MHHAHDLCQIHTDEQLVAWIHQDAVLAEFFQVCFCKELSWNLIVSCTKVICCLNFYLDLAVGFSFLVQKIEACADPGECIIAFIHCECCLGSDNVELFQRSLVVHTFQTNRICQQLLTVVITDLCRCIDVNIEIIHALHCRNGAFDSRQLFIRLRHAESLIGMRNGSSRFRLCCGRSRRLIVDLFSKLDIDRIGMSALDRLCCHWLRAVCLICRAKWSCCRVLTVVVIAVDTCRWLSCISLAKR